MKNFDSTNHLLAKVTLNKSLNNIKKYHSSAINILTQIEKLSDCKNFKIILKPYSKDQLVNKNIQDDFNAIIGLKTKNKL